MEYKVILIQGAMNIEIEYLINQLKEKEKIAIAEYEFYKGTISNKTIIISKTLIGTINATIATSIGISRFKPDVIINQGIAGAHKKDIHIGDIVIGEKCCNINSYSMPTKSENEGTNPFEWEPDKRAKQVQNADDNLLKCVKEKLFLNYKRKVFIGTLGSGDVFNREIDRINWINNTFGNLCEDMESIGIYTTCNKYKIPCIGIRIISNNEITGEEFDEAQAIHLQKLLIEVLKN